MIFMGKCLGGDLVGRQVQWKAVKGKEVQTGIKIFSLTKPGGANSILSGDFEIEARWKILRGHGLIKLERGHKLEGQYSLLLEANQEDMLVVEASIPGLIELKNNTLVVLLYSGHNLTSDGYGPKNLVGAPYLAVKDLQSGQTHRLRIGKLNTGIRSEISELQTREEAYDWTVISYIGFFLPGRYSLALRLVAPKGQSVLYDSLRLFVLEPHGL